MFVELGFPKMLRKSSSEAPRAMFENRANGSDRRGDPVFSLLVVTSQAFNDTAVPLSDDTRFLLHVACLSDFRFTQFEFSLHPVAFASKKYDVGAVKNSVDRGTRQNRLRKHFTPFADVAV